MFPVHEAIPFSIDFNLYLLHILQCQLLKPALCPLALFNHKTPNVVHDGASQISIITKTTKNLRYCVIQMIKYLSSSVFIIMTTHMMQEVGSENF